MRFDAAFRVACACCKADGANVPEVEAVIRLLLPTLLGAWRDRVASMQRDAERILSGNIAPEDVALLLAAYVARLEAIAATPLPAGARLRIEQAAGELAASAAQRFALPLPGAVGVAREVLAAEQIQLLLEEAANRTITASQEAARAFLASPAGPGSEETREAARSALRDALATEQALLPLLDSWAYRVWNTATVRAAAADGHNFIQLAARIDDATTAFCRLVNGRIVPISLVLGQLNRIDAAVQSGDPAALVTAAPFVTNARTATQADVDAVLARGGIAPFHFGCRTQNVPVRLARP